MKIRILREAEVDLIEGFNFYEFQQAGLGIYFLDSLYSDIDSLLVSAGAHPLVFDHHRLLSKRFPFAVYYILKDDLISIHAILDCRRSPAWSRAKLK